MNAIEWLFSMKDGISGPAKAAKGNLGELVQTVHSSLASIQLIGQAAMGAGRLIAEGLAPAVTKEKTLGAFKTLLGTAEKAKDMYAQAVEFAAATPFETADVVKGFQGLLTAHIKPVDVPVAMEIIGDATSMQQNSAEAMSTVIQQMGQMRSLGKVTMEDLKPIMQATMMDGKLYASTLAHIYGVSTAQIATMQSKGMIDAETGTFAILSTLQQQFGGNMKEASQQVQGLWSTIESYPEQYLEELMDTRGYESMRGALKNIADVFDPINGKGKILLGTIKDFGGGMLERIFGDLSGTEGASRVEDILLEVNDLLADVKAGMFGLMDGFSEAFGSMDKFGTNAKGHEQTMVDVQHTMESIGVAAGGAARAIDTVGTAFLKVYEFGDYLSEHPIVNALLMAGIGAAGGTVVGGPIGALVGAAAGLTAGAATYIAGSAAATGIELSNTQGYGTSAGQRGDALMFQQLAAGAGTGAGLDDLDIPAFADGGIVNRRTLAWVGEAGPEAIIPLAQMGGGTGGSSPLAQMGSSMAPIQISMPISISGMTAEGGARAGRELIAQVEPALYAIFERMALSSGRRLA